MIGCETYCSLCFYEVFAFLPSTCTSRPLSPAPLFFFFSLPFSVSRPPLPRLYVACRSPLGPRHGTSAVEWHRNGPSRQSPRRHHRCAPVLAAPPCASSPRRGRRRAAPHPGGGGGAPPAAARRAPPTGAPGGAQHAARGGPLWSRRGGWRPRRSPRADALASWMATVRRLQQPPLSTYPLPRQGPQRPRHPGQSARAAGRCGRPAVRQPIAVAGGHTPPAAAESVARAGEQQKPEWHPRRRRRQQLGAAGPPRRPHPPRQPPLDLHHPTRPATAATASSQSEG